MAQHGRLPEQQHCREAILQSAPWRLLCRTGTHNANEGLAIAVPPSSSYRWHTTPIGMTGDERSRNFEVIASALWRTGRQGETVITKTTTRDGS